MQIKISKEDLDRFKQWLEEKVAKMNTPEGRQANRALFVATPEEYALLLVTRELDAMVVRMNTPEARAASRALSSTTPEEFGMAALRAAKARNQSS